MELEKSEVIKVFVYFARNVSIQLGWIYDSDVIKITAMTGAAACEIPNGKTLHSQACLTRTKITQLNIDSWKSTKMLVIDEVSLFRESGEQQAILDFTYKKTTVFKQP